MVCFGVQRKEPEVNVKLVYVMERKASNVGEWNGELLGGK